MDYSFFDSLLDAVFVVDENRRVKYCNDSAATLCQSSVRRITKGEGVELYSLLKTSNPDSYVNESGNNGKDHPSPWEEVSFELLKADIKGKIQVAIQPFTQADGERRWVMTFHDVTLEESLHQKYQGELEQKEDMIKELQEARAALEDYSKNLEQKVEERTQEVRKANKMLKAIMDSLGQGFLVFDKSGWCGDIFTKACLDVLESEPLDKNIIDVLGLEGDEKEQFEKWAQATFSKALPFESMKELAPQLYDHSKGKRVALDYFPINSDDGELGNIVLVATDKTSEYEANKALEKERQFAKMVVKLIKNRNHFSEFLGGVQEMIEEVEVEISKGPENIDVDYLFRMLHTLEGEAGAFHAFALKQSSRDFQEVTEVLRKNPSSVSEEELRHGLDNFKATYKNFMKDNNEVFSVVLFNKASYVEVPVQSVDDFAKLLRDNGFPNELQQKFQDDFIKQDLKDSLVHLNDVAQQIARKQGKILQPVKFDTQGIRIYPDTYKDLISSLIHAFRNAVDHGLESPADRELMNKPEECFIQVLARRVEKNGSPNIQIEIQDDGRGIDPERIRQKLKEKDLNYQGMEDHEILQQIFVPGFSSRSEVTEFSGRGVGMDAIKTEVDRLGGQIHVESKINQGTKITIEIPENSSKNVYALSA